MALFKDMLKSGESLFRDTVMLDYDFQPKIIQFRETEQSRFAIAIKPLLQGHNGRNLFVYGAPGIGKTTACKHVLRELEEETDQIIPLYINCWKENTSFKILTKLCEDLGFKFIQNKKTNELFQLIKGRLNKQSAVFIFDEIDKLEDNDFLYIILEDIYRKSIILITNYRDSYSEFDERIAEDKSSRSITLSHVAEAINKVEDFHIKPKNTLDDDPQKILEIAKNNTGKKIGEIYNAYVEANGEMSYKSFQRRILKLSEGRFIKTEKIGGDGGNSTIIHYSIEKKLTEF